MTKKSFVSSPIVRDSTLLVPKSLIAKPYVLPFFLLYATFAQLYFQQYDRYIKGPEWTFVYLGTLVSLNILVMLMPAWNVKIKAKFNYSTTKNVNEATHILIYTTPNNGSDGIVEIQRVTEAGSLQTFSNFKRKDSCGMKMSRYFLHQSSLLMNPQRSVISKNVRAIPVT